MRNLILGILKIVIGTSIVILITKYVFDERDARGAVDIYETRVEIPQEMQEVVVEKISEILNIDSRDYERQAELQSFMARDFPTALQQYLIKNNDEVKGIEIDIKFDGFMWAVIDGDPLTLDDVKNVVTRHLSPEQEISIIGGSRGSVSFPVRFWSGGNLFVSTGGYYYDSFQMETPLEGIFSVNTFVLKNVELLGFIIYIILLLLIVFAVVVIIFGIGSIFSALKGKEADGKESSD